MKVVCMNFRHLWRARLLLVLFNFCTGSVYGVEIPGYPANVLEYEAREVAMLPRYCIYTQDYRGKVPGANNQVEIDRWYSLLGKTFHAMHHYCWGLMKTNRAIFLAQNQRDRQFLLGEAIMEFDYVITRAPLEFVLLPEILTKKGENLIRLGRAEGVAELLRAIGLKPDYWPPYAVLSDYFKQFGDLAKARKWLEQGLSAAPDAKPLRRRLAELGGREGHKFVPPPRTKPPLPAKGVLSAPSSKAENPEPSAER